MFYYFALCMLYIPIRLLYPTKVIGKENFIKGRAIYAANHMTNLDIVIIGLCAGVKRRLSMLAKKELFKGKFSTWIFTHLGAIPVDRGKVDVNAIKQSLKVLNNDDILLVFPNGTRTQTPEEVDNMKAGIAKFALQTGAPIVPIMLQKKPKIFRFNRLYVGTPIDVTEYMARKKDPEAVNELMEKVRVEMHKLIEG